MSFFLIYPLSFIYHHTGLSPIAVNLFGLFLATLASEIIKIRSRLILPQRTRVENGPSMYDLMRFQNPSMFDLMKFRAKNELPLTGSERMPMLGKFTGTELKADIIKWLLVYSFLPSSNRLVGPEEAIAIGALSGLLSQLVRENDDKTAAQISVELENSKRRPWDPKRSRPDYPLTRIARSCVEGATQLLAYEAAREYVYAISPYFQSLQVASADNSSPLVALIKLIQEALVNPDSIPSLL